MKTDGATGPLGKIIIYIYSSRSKNIFIKCKCMTTISPFVGRILTTENLWCSQFPSFRFFFCIQTTLCIGLIQWHGCSCLICCQVPEEKRTDRRSVGWWRVSLLPEGNFHHLKQIHLRGDLDILLSAEKSTKLFPWQSSFVRAPSPPALPQQNNNKSWWETFKIYRISSHTHSPRYHSFGVYIPTHI